MWSSIDVAEKPSDVNAVHSGIEEVCRCARSHSREGQELDAVMDKRLADSPHEPLTGEWFAGFVFDEHKEVLLVVDHGRPNDLQIVLDPVEGDRTCGNKPVLRLFDKQNALGEINIADLERLDLPRSEC